MDKRLAIEWLQKEHNTRQEIPSELFSIIGSADIRKITRDIASEVAGRLRKEDYSSVEYFLNEGLKPDDLLEKVEQDLLMTNIRTHSVSMIVSHADAIQRNLPMDIRMALISLANKYSPLKAVKSIVGGVTPLVCFYNSQENDLYFKYDSSIYAVHNATNLSLMDYEVILPVEPTDVCFVNNFKDEKIQSSKFLSSILGDMSIKLKEFLADKRKQVYVHYTDIYVSNPISCLIIAQVLHQFETEYGLEINDVTIDTGHQFKSNSDYRRQNYLDTDFSMSAERDEYLEDSIVGNIGDVPVKIDTSKKLPHARLLTIQNSEFEITINPDGGFAQGWKAFREYSTTVENDRTKSIELTNTLYRNNIPIRFTVGWCKK